MGRPRNAHVQTDLEADGRLAITLAELIIGGSLTSMDIRDDQAAGGTSEASVTKIPLACGM